MQSTFNLRRFGLLLRHDLHLCRPGYGEMFATILGGMLFPTFMVLVQWITGYGSIDAASPLYRLLITVGYSCAMGFAIPSQLYFQVAGKGKGRGKRRNSGVYYALLPASKGEKYWVMFLMSLLVVPVFIITGALMLDTLLALFHVGPWQQFFWQIGPIKYPINPWFTANLVAFEVLAVAVALWVNAIRNNWITLVAVLILFGLMFLVVAGSLALVVEFAPFQVAIFALQLVMLAAAILLGRRRLNRITY